MRKLIELFEGRDGKWYFHVKHRNGQIGDHSQGYLQKRYAKVAIKRDYPGAKIVEINA